MNYGIFWKMKLSSFDGLLFSDNDVRNVICSWQSGVAASASLDVFGESLRETQKRIRRKESRAIFTPLREISQSWHGAENVRYFFKHSIKLFYISIYILILGFTIYILQFPLNFHSKMVQKIIRNRIITLE